MVSMVERLLLLGDQVNCDIWREESRAFHKVEIGITGTAQKKKRKKKKRKKPGRFIYKG